MNPILNDPEFLEWERNQVGELTPERVRERRSDYLSEEFGEPLEWFRYEPGSSSPSSLGFTVQPLMSIKKDRSPIQNGVRTPDSMVMIFEDDTPRDFTL
jgi:hypothetical protein